MALCDVIEDSQLISIEIELSDCVAVVFDDIIYSVLPFQFSVFSLASSKTLVSGL
jgi:hypothetical protein